MNMFLNYFTVRLKYTSRCSFHMYVGQRPTYITNTVKYVHFLYIIIYKRN